MTTWFVCTKYVLAEESFFFFLGFDSCVFLFISVPVQWTLEEFVVFSDDYVCQNLVELGLMRAWLKSLVRVGVFVRFDVDILSYPRLCDCSFCISILRS